MRSIRKTLFALSLAAIVAPAHAAWGDISYDPNPTRIDEDASAQFDSFGLMSLAISNASGLTTGIQKFESGFSGGQTINSWIPVGGNNVRLGFGNTLSSIRWEGLIGAVDTAATQFGLENPHGTYGNEPGVVGQPRNYVADLNFIMAPESAAGSSYFVMQFETPVSFLAFSMADYGKTGDTFSFTLWNGEGLDSLISVEQSIAGNTTRTVQDGQPEGGFENLIGSGAISSSSPSTRPSFKYAIVRLDTPDTTVGFDNFIIGTSSVPEPGSLPLAGLGLLGIATFLRRPVKGRI